MNQNHETACLKGAILYHIMNTKKKAENPRWKKNEKDTASDSPSPHTAGS